MTASERTRMLHAAYSRKRRARMIAARICIASETHGPATHGILCERCREVHRKSAGGSTSRATRKRIQKFDALVARMARKIKINPIAVLINTRRAA